MGHKPGLDIVEEVLCHASNQNPRSLRPQTRHYTNLAIPVTILLYTPSLLPYDSRAGGGLRHVCSKRSKTLGSYSNTYIPHGPYKNPTKQEHKHETAQKEI
jgi:hypothetical protein